MEFYNFEDTNPLVEIADFIIWIAVVIALSIFCVYCFAGVATSTGSSMSPLLESGEGALVDKLIYKISSPKRGDIIAFTGSGEDINIKRVIALPGESIKISNGDIYIDGKRLDSGKIKAGKINIPGLAENEITLAEDEYFVIGDNADASEDSRFESIGNVKRESIIGKLWLRCHPLIRIKLIG